MLQRILYSVAVVRSFQKSKNCKLNSLFYTVTINNNTYNLEYQIAYFSFWTLQ